MPDLATLRAEIDAIDAELVAVLARRFQVVDKVIVIKRATGLPATIPDRIKEVVANISQRAIAVGIPEAAAKRLWCVLIAETIAYEEACTG